MGIHHSSIRMCSSRRIFLFSSDALGLSSIQRFIAKNYLHPQKSHYEIFAYILTVNWVHGTFIYNHSSHQLVVRTLLQRPDLIGYSLYQHIVSSSQIQYFRPLTILPHYFVPVVSIVITYYYCYQKHWSVLDISVLLLLEYYQCFFMLLV